VGALPQRPLEQAAADGRYLYEHLFLGHLVFDGDPQRHVFRLVRSATPPGARRCTPLATRRPFDDPGVATWHYRLLPERETLLAKTHMPMTLSPQRMARWQGWFIDAAYTVDRLPPYTPRRGVQPLQDLRRAATARRATASCWTRRSSSS
jgi:hypothetical protein